MRYGAVVRIVRLVVTCLVTARLAAADGTWEPPQLQDLTALQPLTDAPTRASADQLAGLLSLFRETSVRPGGVAMGLGGGPMDTAYTQEAILYSIGRYVPAATLVAAIDGEASPDVRRGLIVAAGLAGADGITEELVGIATNAEEGFMRRLATMALSQLQDASLEPFFRQRLTDPYARLTYGGVGGGGPTKIYPVRQAAAEGLARLGVTDIDAVTAVPLRVGSMAEMVATLLEDRVPEVCLSAVRVLGQMGDEGAPYLRAFAEDAAGDVSLSAAVQVARLASLTAEELIGALRAALSREDRLIYQAAAEQLRGRGDAAVAAIVSAYPDADPAFHEASVWILAGVRTATAANALLAIFVDTSEEEQVRWQAMEALAGRRSGRPLTAAEMAVCAEAVSSAPMDRASLIASFLGGQTQGDTRPPIALLSDRLRQEVTLQPVERDTEAQRLFHLKRFVDGLGALGRRNLPGLQAQLANAEGEWAMWAATARGLAGDDTVTAELEVALRSQENPYLRFMLVQAVAQAGGTEAVPLLTELLEDATMAPGDGFLPARRYAQVPLVRIAAEMELHRIRSTTR